MRLPPVLRTLRFILEHPLNRGRPFPALADYVRWQVGGRLVSGPVAVPFVEGSRLLVDPGMSGATSNVYSALGDFEEMGFALHLIRPGDLFVDVGANIGSYTILAAALGAPVIAFEPVSSAGDRLAWNVRLNGFESLVDFHRCAVGSVTAEVTMSSDRGTVNRVLLPQESDEHSITVQVETLDDVLESRVPTLIKIDVEGLEAEVIEGAGRTLREGAGALIVETNGSGERYGHSDGAIDRRLSQAGYRSIRYDPLTRAVEARSGPNSRGNTIYVRDLARVAEQLRNAPERRLAGGRRL